METIIKREALEIGGNRSMVVFYMGAKLIGNAIDQLVVAVFLILLTSVPSFGDSQFDADRPTVFLGAGYDVAIGKILDQCVKFNDFPKGDKEDGARLITSDMNLIEKTENIEKLFNVGVEANYGRMVSGKVNFINNRKINSYSVYVLVEVKVLTPTSKIKELELKDFAAKLARNDPKRFQEICGDEVVIAFAKGGGLYGIIEIATSTTTEKNTITASLGSQIGLFKSTGDLSKIDTATFKGKNVRVNVILTGSKGEEPLPSTAEELIHFASKFPKSGFESPTPYIAYTRSYNMIQNWPESVNRWAAEDKINIINKLSAIRVDSLSKLNDIDYILSHPDQFSYPDINPLNTTYKNLATTLNAIKAASDSCFEDATKCKYPENIDVVNINLPPRIGNPNCSKMLAPACGAASYNKGRAAVCGVERHNLATGAVCGAKLYLLKRSAACGVELYKQAKHAECGEVPKPSPSPVSMMSLALPCVILPGGCPPPNYNECRTTGNGVESYKECRDSTHGVEFYNDCRHAAFGVESYLECFDKSFGIEKYLSCLVDIHTGERCE